MYSIMSFANSDDLICFPTWIILTSCYSLIVVARTFKTIFNKSGKRAHPFLVADLRGNAFSFSAFIMILTIDLLYMTFIMLKYVLSLPCFW